ncbi:MAG: TonB-dependent receptor [Pseudomonadota bacterium]
MVYSARGLAQTGLVSALALGIVPLHASAQTESSDTEQIRTFETVTVTARRQEETLFTVPGQVSAFDADTLVQDLAAENLGALQGTVPNLNLVQGRGSSSSANIYIRGIGQPDALATFDPAVGVYVDDVYISRIRGALFDVYDVERIEVLRGPQGTLYGKNTNGGALKIVSKKPGDEFEALGRLSYGSYNAIEAAGSISGPLIADMLGGGFSLYRGSRDGYVEDPNGDFEYNDKDTWAARGTLVWTPTDPLEVVINADYTEESPALTVGQPQSLLFAVDLAPPTPAQTIVPLFVPSGDEFDYETSTSLTRAGGTDLENSNELTHAGIGITASYDLNENWTLKSITAHRDLEYDDFIDIDATPLELGDVFVGVEQDQTSQEFQLLYDGDGAISGVGGVFWLNENVSSFQQAYADDFLLFGGFPLAFTRDIEDNLNLHSYAAFGNLVYDVNDRLSVTGGLRYTYELKTYQRATSTTLVPTPFSFGVSESWEDVSPLVSVDYQFDDDLFGYAKVAKGFKSGGFNGRANAPGDETPYDPEIVWSYEAGFRKALNNGRVNLSGAVFYNDYQDFQARVSVARGPGEFDFPVFNAGELEIYGAELEFQALIGEGLTLDAQIGYLDAEYGEFLDQNAPTGDRADTDEPAFAPDWTARFGTTYDFDLADSGTLTFGADANYRGEHALAVDQQVPEVFQDAYWLANARIVWSDPSDSWTVGLYGKNLTDEVYKTDFQEFSSVGGIRTAYFGAPQTVQLQITKRY